MRVSVTKHPSEEEYNEHSSVEEDDGRMSFPYDDEHAINDFIAEKEYEGIARREDFARSVAMIKNRFSRSLTYVAWINTPLLSLTLLNTLVLLGLELNLMVWVPIVFVGSIIALLFIGYVDEMIGVLSAEQKYAWDRNDAFRELRDEMRSLKEEVKRR